MQEQWNGYVAKVLPPDTPDVQKTECRRAFYAGGQASIWAVIQALTPGPDSQPADEEVLADMQNELNDFVKSVTEGRA